MGNVMLKKLIHSFLPRNSWFSVSQLMVFCQGKSWLSAFSCPYSNDK